MDDELKHCCIYMDYALSGINGYLVEYMPEIRSYTLRFYDKEEFTGMEKALWYCPWCGTKLPETLGDEWEEALKKEHNLTTKDFINQKGRWDESRIPEEFRTDEWWKKRGL